MNSTTSGDNHRQYCLEQVLLTNRIYALSSQFSSAEHADRILALYALIASLSRVICEPSEEEISLRKLAWWREELLDRALAESPHPVVKELVRSGCADRVGRDQLEELLVQAHQRIDPTPPADQDQLHDRLARMIRPQLLLEAAVVEVPLPTEQFTPVTATACLQLIRESLSSPGESGFWWVPMNQLARHGARREDLMTSEAGASVLQSVLKSVGEALAGTKAKLPRHFDLMEHLGQRQLRRLGAPAEWPQQIQTLKFSDSFSAWRYSRSNP